MLIPTIRCLNKKVYYLLFISIEACFKLEEVAFNIIFPAFL